ncbi:hypothetical protein FKP32DRAFT_1558540, partial [Trametes sanguinea]
ITVVWVLGHKGVAGNEHADMEAKDASMGDETDLPPALQCLRHLPKSQSALKATYKKTRLARTCIITQLQSGHVGLHAFLHHIKAVSSPLCPTCQCPETVHHWPSISKPPKFLTAL